MTLDLNEQKLVQKLTTVLSLIGATEEELKKVYSTTIVDKNYLLQVEQIIERHSAMCLEFDTLHNWRDMLDDDFVFDIIDGWIEWKLGKEPAVDNSYEAMMRRMKEDLTEKPMEEQ